jgi:hypothetical protein
MKFQTNRRKFLFLLSSTLAWFFTPTLAQNIEPDRPRRRAPGGGRRRSADDYVLPPELAAFSLLSLVLGRVSDRSVTVSVLAKETMEGYFEYGTAPGNYGRKTNLLALPAGQPVELVFDSLQPNTEYFYRLQYRQPGEAAFHARPECRFHTQRAAGSTFMFAIQGDSHPERPQMSDPDLYARTLLNAAAAKPDFYICMGDDFSVDTLQTLNADRWPNATHCNVRFSAWWRNPLRCFWSTAIMNRRRCSISIKRTFAMKSRCWPRMPATGFIRCPRRTIFIPATPSH